jgi:4-hydroxy-tetrahydrodipicolinate reductase
MPVGSPESGNKVRVAIVGFGRVGRAVLELATLRPWMDVVGVMARRPERTGEPAALTVPTAATGLKVRTDVAQALRDEPPDVVIMATSSSLADVRPQLAVMLDAGTRVIVSSSEELAYVDSDDDPDAMGIAELIHSADATVVATGVNPGFVLDVLPLSLSGLAWDIERIEARRTVDVSVFAPGARSRLGIGHDRSAFESGLADGTIVGHLGFRESLRILGTALGLPGASRPVAWRMSPRLLRPSSRAEIFPSRGGRR